MIVFYAAYLTNVNRSYAFKEARYATVAAIVKYRHFVAAFLQVVL